jgi:hypothetical protein
MKNATRLEAYDSIPRRTNTPNSLAIEKNPPTNEKYMDHVTAGLMLDNKHACRQLNHEETSQTSSIVPPPPVLQQQSHFSQPGAFRMSGGRLQSSDLDSAVNTMDSHPSSCQHSPEVLAMHESEVDQECSTHPTPMTAATAVTANPMSVVEAEPIAKHTLREFFDNGKVKFVICLLLSFFVLLVLGAAYWLIGFNVNELGASGDLTEPTIAPTSPDDPELKIFSREALPEYTRSALRKANSPQSKALSWLKNNSYLEAYPLNRRLQRFALATIYFATGGDRRWKRNDGWLSELDECNSWYTTSAADSFPCSGGMITHLSLRELNLVGNIPNEIGLLSALNSIDLSSNQITGTMPTSFTDLYALQEILLFDNYISGEIPALIGKLKGMEVIDLGFNFLAGTVPAFGELSNLRHVHLDRNLLSSVLPASIGKLSKLESLYLFGNAFEGTLDELSMSFSGLASMKHLAIDRNRLSGTLPQSLSLLTNLRSLTLGNNTFASTIPVELYKRCTELEVLDVFDTSLSGTIASEIHFLTNIRALFMEENHFFGTLPIEVGDLQSLEILWLHTNNFHGKLPSELGRLTNLRDFQVQGNELTGEVPKTVCDLVKSGRLPAHNLTIDCSLMACSCCEACLTSESRSMVNP